MIIKKIGILNYKSIQEMSIPCDHKYGDSKTVFLLGINESGKSNILEAINQIGNKFENLTFESICYKANEKQENATVAITLELELDANTITDMYKRLMNKFDFLKNRGINLTIENNIKLTKCLYKNNSPTCIMDITLCVSDDFPFHRYAVAHENIVARNPVEQVRNPTINEEQIRDQRALIQLKVKEFIEPLILQKIPKVIYWNSSQQYLIDKSISLTEFKNNPEISIPLKNMFLIHGRPTHRNIRETIDSALNNEEMKSELEDELSIVVTKHIKGIWEEHKVGIRIKIDGDNLKVHIEDEDKKRKYYNMKQRSDGFKQFISLLLTLSAQHKGNILKNNIILLDEPEVHLHPSGVKCMRNELLNIGKDNYVFVATHSPSMVDSRVMERHWVVTKNKMETSIFFPDKSTNMSDDDVLKTAFGINKFRELLPKNIILVEGKNDKKLIEHAIHVRVKSREKPDLIIKSADGASNLYPTAALLNKENINVYIMCDADGVGRKCVQRIKDRLKPGFSNKNVFTLKDLEPKLPQGAEIEDTLPSNFVANFLKENYNATNFDKSKTVSSFIKNNLSLNDEEQSKLKWELRKSFITADVREGGYIFSIAQTLISKFDETQK